MKRACAATAKSTREPCKRNALHGSRYCIFHVEKKPLLCGVIISAILGYLLGWILPSQELIELRKLRNDLLTYAKSLNPELDDKAAITFLLAEFEKALEWNSRQKRASTLGITLPGGPSYDPNLVSAFSNLLDHVDPAVRNAAETCLKTMGTEEALKAIQEYRKK
jgi:hypothetical protein